MRIAVHDYAGHPFQVDLSRELARRGHAVWHIYFAGDKGPKGTMSRTLEDPKGLEFLPIDINRDYSKSNFITRRANDINYGRLVAKQILELKPDLVISGNTPLDAQKSIIAATHRADGKFINWIQDFYSLAIARLIGNKWFGLGALIAEYYRLLDRCQLADSDGAVLISEDFRRSLTGFEQRPDRVVVIPNWGAIEGIPLRPKDNAWSRARSLHDNFVFLYSGTLGLKHNPEALVALADAFSDKPEVRVVVAASGIGRERLDEIVAVSPRPNLVTLPLQPIGDFPDMLGSADVFVAVLENDAGQFSVPSKVLSYLCAGHPILLAAPTANLASQMIRGAEAGLVMGSHDTDDLIEAARKLYKDSNARERMAKAARVYAEGNFMINNVTTRFEQFFEYVIATRTTRTAKSAI